ncbi:nuclease-related domain-containing protein [Deinococcus sp. A31D244]|uniref:nuclease-related domain-containing protein n=1 Tax=Deinococcus sp. A31D244 TaxID=3397675 RepID=UPI0039E0ADEC
MIVKDLEPQTHTDPLRRAGYEAERQMAHYLKRAFAEDGYKFVFHNLRLVRKDEVAQIDHLILHRYGLMIVESKSVAGQVSVNEHGEWTRWWNRQGRGMPSPVLQARRQLDLLLALLEDHTTELMDRSMLGLKQRTFTGIRRDILVAISDSGRITRKSDVPELVKADQVPERIGSLVQQQFDRTFGSFGFTDAEMTRLQSFLKARHVAVSAVEDYVAQREAEGESVRGEPVGRSAFPPRPVRFGQPEPVFEAAPLASPERSGSPVRTSQERQAQARPRPDVACRACSSVNVTVQFGKYGYYLKCADCGGNTPAKPVCAQCGQPGKVSKRGLEFTASCAGGHSWVYWTNPA